MPQRRPPIARFSGPRHRTIADLADDFLTPNAKSKVQKILKKLNVVKLKDVATWADQIKPRVNNKPKDNDTKDFLKKFPDTREWHFVDLPLDTNSYDVVKYAAFVRENDIVHMAIESINILIDQSTKFSKLNALRWLVHLVGDMHQPLHIACSYIDPGGTKPKLVFKRDEVLSKQLLQKTDKGGNNIALPFAPPGKSLHSYWDDDLPEKDNNFSGIVFNPPPSVPINKLKELPALWVSENVQFSKEAYSGLTVKGKNAAQPTHVDVTWNKFEYDKRCGRLIKTMSEKAANRLAFLLNTIYG